MKISSKGRYALASMILLAQNTSENENLTVLAISQKLEVSKIYLEQAFALLRRGGLVNSTKGSQGGYQLAKPASEISAADILALTETSIFEEPESTAKNAVPGIDRALRETLFQPANQVFRGIFEQMPLSDLAEESLRRSADDGYIYCI